MTRTASRQPPVLRAILWNSRWGLAAALIAVGGAAGILALIPPWVGKLVSTILPSRDYVALQRHLLLGLVLIVASQALTFWREYQRRTLSHRIGAEMRAVLFSRIVAMPFPQLAEHRTGDLLSRLSNDVVVFQDSLMNGVLLFLPNAVFLLCLSGLMMRYSLLLAAFTPVVVVPLGLTIHFFLGRMRESSRVAQEQAGLINNLVEESIRGTKEVRIFGQERRLRERFAALNLRSTLARIEQARLTSLHPAVAQCVVYVGFSVFILAGFWLVRRGLLTMEDLVAYLTCLVLFYMPSQQVIQSFGHISRTYSVLDRFDELLRPSESDEALETLPPLPDLAGHIAFRDVCFSYGQGFGLKNITLSVAPGEMVAIVGPSGAGKTTLLSLIPRFLNPDAGSITADGIPIDGCELQSLRRQIGFVTQEPVLFDGTIEENIAFAKPEASRAEIVAAARAARVDDFVAGFPEGYQTRVGQNGSALSLGQRQRIAIARALLPRTRVLLMDEPASALDAESEQLIRDTLWEIRMERTIIIVAHRLSTIRDADRIVVLDGGRVVGAGNHDALLADGGLYHRLYSSGLPS